MPAVHQYNLTTRAEDSYVNSSSTIFMRNDARFLLIINSMKDGTHYLTLPLKIMCSLEKIGFSFHSYRVATNQFLLALKGCRISYND